MNISSKIFRFYKEVREDPRYQALSPEKKQKLDALFKQYHYSNLVKETEQQVSDSGDLLVPREKQAAVQTAVHVAGATPGVLKGFTIGSAIGGLPGGVIGAGLGGFSTSILARRISDLLGLTEQAKPLEETIKESAIVPEAIKPAVAGNVPYVVENIVPLFTGPIGLGGLAVRGALENLRKLEELRALGEPPEIYGETMPGGGSAIRAAVEPIIPILAFGAAQRGAEALAPKLWSGASPLQRAIAGATAAAPTVGISGLALKDIKDIYEKKVEEGKPPATALKETFEEGGLGKILESLAFLYPAYKTFKAYREPSVVPTERVTKVEPPKWGEIIRNVLNKIPEADRAKVLRGIDSALKEGKSISEAVSKATADVTTIPSVEMKDIGKRIKRILQKIPESERSQVIEKINAELMAGKKFEDILGETKKEQPVKPVTEKPVEPPKTLPEGKKPVPVGEVETRVEPPKIEPPVQEYRPTVGELLEKPDVGLPEAKLPQKLTPAEEIGTQVEPAKIEPPAQERQPTIGELWVKTDVELPEVKPEEELPRPTTEVKTEAIEPPVKKLGEMIVDVAKDPAKLQDENVSNEITNSIAESSKEGVNSVLMLEKLKDAAPAAMMPIVENIEKTAKTLVINVDEKEKKQKPILLHEIDNAYEKYGLKDLWEKAKAIANESPNYQTFVEKIPSRVRNELGDKLETIWAMASDYNSIDDAFSRGVVFVGLRAKKLPPNVKPISEAMEMLKQGVPEEEVWKKTGWFLGKYDKIPRAELSSEYATLSEKAKNRVDFLPLNEALHFPELFEAYPELADIKVVYAPRSDNVAGEYLHELKRIKIYGDQPLYVYLHEVQHAIQKIEGLPFGSAVLPTSFDVINEASNSLVNKLAKDTANRLKNTIKERISDRKLLEQILNERSDKQSAEALEIATKIRRLDKEIKGLTAYQRVLEGEDINAKRQLILKHDPAAVYKYIAGEIEAATLLDRMTTKVEKMASEIPTKGMPEEGIIIYRDEFGNVIPKDKASDNYIETESQGKISRLADNLSRFFLGEPSKFEKGAPPLKLPDGREIKFDSLVADIKYRNSRIETLSGQTKVIKMAKDFFNSFFRKYPELDPGIYGELINTLNYHERAGNYAIEMAKHYIYSIVGGLSPEEFDIFTRYIVLKSLERDIQKGLYKPTGDGLITLPFYGRTEVNRFRADLDKFEKLVQDFPKVKEALDKRKKFISSLVDDLIDNNLISSKVKGSEDSYFHHQVLKYYKPESLSLRLGKKTPGIYKRGFSKARKEEVVEEYNTNYLESEFEWVAQAIKDIATREVEKKIRGSLDIRDYLAREAKLRNEAQFLITADELEIKEFEKYRKVLGILTRKLRAMAAITKGKISPERISDKLLNEVEKQGFVGVSKKYQYLIDRFAYDFLKEMQAAKKKGTYRADWEDPNLFKFFNELIISDLPGKDIAVAFLSTIGKRERLIRKQLGENYLTPEKLIPPGYVVWTPKEGSRFFLVNTIGDRVLDEVLSRKRDLLPSDVKRIRMAVPKADRWIIPKEVADAFNRLDREANLQLDRSVLERAASGLQSGLKWLYTMGPFSISKYVLNNTLGDLDITLAYDTNILKYAIEARKRINEKGYDDPLVKAALKYGLLGTGKAATEIPDIKYDPIFDKILGRREGAVIGTVKALHGAVRDLQVKKEDILRLGAMLYFLSPEGRNKLGASRADEVAQIKDPVERAARLAADLYGNYGNISKAGEFIRKYIAFFWSWIEINAPRYVRILKNTLLESTIKGEEDKDFYEKVREYKWKDVKKNLGKETAKAYAKRIFGMSLISTMIGLFNKIFFPEEDKRLHYGREGQYLILHKSDDGELVSVRATGAFMDALGWLGLDSPLTDIEDFVHNNKTIEEKLGEVYWRFVSKSINSIFPFQKALFESYTRKSLYPSVNRPQPIRDPYEHWARFFGVAPVYNVFAKKPGKKLTDIPMSLIFNFTDVYELAYFQIREKVRKYLSKKGIERPMVDVTPKQIALYYYKKSLAIGEKELAKKYYKEYIKQGGSQKALNISIKRSHPLGDLSEADKAKFKATLTTRERRMLEDAIEWYNRIFIGSKSVRGGL